MIAVDWVSRQSWVAPGKAGLFGISFGAATIMDAFVLDAPGKMPTSLSQKPPGGLKTVKGAAMLSPWCASDVMGFNLIKAVHEDFSRKVPILAILPGSDSVSDQALCQSILGRHKAKGQDITIVPVSGAGHTFAQENDDYGDQFEDYDAAEAKKAWGRIYAFFKKRLG
jgi:dienelactone hydrolase